MEYRIRDDYNIQIMERSFKNSLVSPFRRKIAKKSMKVDTRSCKNVSEMKAKTINQKMLYEMFNDDDVHINPLPAPAFIHPDSLDVITPKIKHYPFINPRLYKNNKSNGF